MRYANLDALASGKQKRDPLSEWNEILQNTAATKVSEATKHQINTHSAAIAQALEGRARVVASDLASKPLTLCTAFSEPSILDSASKYLVWEIFTLLVPLRDAVVEAGHAADAIAVAVDPDGERVPVLREFFDFIQLNRKIVFRKKRWP
jgi:hypothetical protein